MALVETHGEELRRFLLARVRSASDVPDILQDIYLRMLRVSHAESIRSPEAYLFTVARHVLQQHSLKTKAALGLDLSEARDFPQAAPDADPALQFAAQQCLDDLQAALDSFTPKVRATFILHRRDGVSIDEIGARLGISRAMVKKNLVKALTQFRQRLDKAE
jgi:RNA polymerase sigma-70 factor (ECF subfamily)